MASKFKVEKTMIAQVKYYETLHVIKDEKGQTIFTGNEELAQRILKLLNKPKRKARK